MKQDTTIHHRKSIRLKEYDYSQAGCYFVTLCLHRHQCVFGEVHGEEMHINRIGEIAHRCWEEIPKHFPCAELDAFVVMPNHIHGIIIIKDLGRDVPRQKDGGQELNVSTEKTHASISSHMGSLSVIIRTFKAAVTTFCRTNGYQNF